MFAMVPDRKYWSFQPPIASTGIETASRQSTNDRSRQKASNVGCARFAANSASASIAPSLVRFATSGQLSISPRSVDLIPPGNTTSWYSDDGDCMGAIATRCSGRSTAAL